jgi:hypothetical protein
VASVAVPSLIELAIAGLERMQLADGTFCLERRAGEPAARGRSLRYSAMVLLGLRRAAAAGYAHPFDLDRLRMRLLEEVASPELRPGDIGLLLWIEASSSAGSRDALVRRLDARLQTIGGLEALTGMELAWIIRGLLGDGQEASSQTGQTLLDEALDLACGPNHSPSGLFFHSNRGRRRRFPNFATQSYLILALATAAALRADDRALGTARAAADTLMRLQRTDGGWPWLYDAATGQVVEHYEIYSVHQHGMAPMALLPLAETCSNPQYREAAERGLSWIDEANELGLELVDEHERWVHRSIRRRRPLDRAVLYVNTAAATLIRRPLLTAGLGLVELNATCRPYELGWLLAAWSGREPIDAGG